MPGPKPKQPPRLRLEPELDAVFAELAKIDSELELGIKAGQVTPEKARDVLEDCLAAYMIERGIRIPKPGRGAPKKFVKALRRLDVRLLVEQGHTVSAALERVAGYHYEFEGVRYGPVDVDTFAKHYHRERKRDRVADDFMRRLHDFRPLRWKRVS
jgi:hypothetical protein